MNSRAVLPLLLLPLVANAAEPAWCSVDPVDRFQQLRRLSLDLRQRAPDLAEYEALVPLDEVPESTVDAYLASEDFKTLVRAYHRELLWPALGGALFYSEIGILLPPTGVPTGPLYVRAGQRLGVYRAAGGPCADRRQTAFEPDGTPVPGPDGLDGWVEVEPYWAPGTTVRVCAYDAQDKLTAQDVVNGSSQQFDCRSRTSYPTRRCGCGPKLSFCNYGTNYRLTRQSVVEQLLRFVERVVVEDRPYTDVLLATEVEINGPVSHFMRWQWGFAVDTIMYPDEGAAIPELPFSAVDTWVPMQRDPHHAGLLTLPAFLLKFPSNRGRANRFHSAFLCQPFQPPPGGLPATDSSEPNVAKRQGCAYCHQTLEPAAAYWGRLAENGTTWLDAAAFPVTNDACRRRDWAGKPFLREACHRLYLSEREPIGTLRAYEFAGDGSPEGSQLARHAEAGPGAFARRAIEDGRFATCTTTRWWRRLLQREPTEDERSGVIRELADGFREHQWSLKWLLKQIVLEPAYRRAGD